MITETGKNKIGLMGLSFKRRADDVRNSPFIEMVEGLIGKGGEVRVYDSYICIDRVFGANKLSLH